MPQANTFKFIGAVYTLLVRERQVLLLRRFNTGWADGWWSLPAGHLEKGEHLRTAAARETLEEAGVSVYENDLTLFHLSHCVYGGRDDQVMNFFFKANTWSGDPFNAEPQRCDALAWHDVDNLPDQLVPVVRLAIREAFQKAENSGFIGPALKEFPLENNASPLLLDV